MHQIRLETPRVPTPDAETNVETQTAAAVQPRHMMPIHKLSPIAAGVLITI